MTRPSPPVTGQSVEQSVGVSPAGPRCQPTASAAEGASSQSGIPNAETLARMGEAAERELMSELGWYDAGKAAWLAWQLAEVRSLPDSEIDTSDIPEVTDWSGAKRGMFTASAIEARSDATGTGAAEGESAGPKDDAP